MRKFHSLAAIAALSMAMPALAAPQKAAPQQDKAAASVPEAGDPEARRRMLNAEQAAAAQQQVQANEASQDQHDTAVALNAMQSDRDAARYAATLDRHDAAEQVYHADRKQWEVKNPACWNGDAAKCPADPQASVN